MELLQLSYFKTVAQYEHMTKAALSLNISQPSLSMTVSSLERELGVSLFDRVGRAIRLNQAGRTFLMRVDRMFEQLENGIAEARAIEGQNLRKIRLGTTSTRFLSRILKQFLETNPQSVVKQSLAVDEELAAAIVDERLDFAISSPPIAHPAVTTVILENEELFLFVPNGHRFAAYSEIDLSEADKEHFIGLTKNYTLRTFMDDWCAEAGFAPNIMFECDKELMSELLTTGKGLTILAKKTFSSDLSRYGKYLRITHPVCQRQIGMSWKKNKKFAKDAELLRTFFIEHYQSGVGK